MKAITQETVDRCHAIAVEKGFWEASQNLAEKLAMIHAEVSEALEELRQPEFDRFKFGEELADVMIRTMDLAGHLKIPMVLEVLSKMERNADRPRLHGKRF